MFPEAGVQETNQTLIIEQNTESVATGTEQF